jgi:ribosome-associated heat shock protein Hsp15
MSEEPVKMRIDKWLWASRFYKTRGLAVDAIEVGKVLVNDTRVKPAKAIGVGDRVDIRVGAYQFNLVVLALSEKRGPAPQAQKLYCESDESRERRALLAEQLRVDRPAFRGRPTKRDRRQIEQFKQGE